MYVWERGKENIWFSETLNPRIYKFISLEIVTPSPHQWPKVEINQFI